MKVTLVTLVLPSESTVTPRIHSGLCVTVSPLFEVMFQGVVPLSSGFKTPIAHPPPGDNIRSSLVIRVTIIRQQIILFCP